jgi:peptidoglycan/LPS O-acetylase OafA/YrhL
VTPKGPAPRPLSLQPREDEHHREQIEDVEGQHRAEDLSEPHRRVPLASGPEGNDDVRDQDRNEEKLLHGAPPPSERRAEAPETKGAHFAALDGLRGLAILLVLFVHFIGDDPAYTRLERVMVKAANYGVWGVDLFFVLSGFLITGILYDSKASPHYFRTFYVRRTLRIFPLYYGTLFVLLCVLPLLPGALPVGLDETVGHSVWLWTYASNIYLAHAGAWSLPYVSHFWSLAVEEQYYLLWPFVVLALPRRSLMALCVGASVVALGLRVALSLAGGSDVARVALTPCRLDALCVGAFLALASRPGRIAQVGHAAKPWLLAFPALVLLTSVWNITVGTLSEVVVPLRGTLVALSFGALLVVCLAAPASSHLGRMARWGALRFLGKYSYGVYVFHGILAYYLDQHHTVDAVTSFLGSRPIAMVVQGTLAASATLLLAIASYELFERHFLRLKDRFAPPDESRPVTAAPVPLPLTLGERRES